MAQDSHPYDSMASEHPPDSGAPDGVMISRRDLLGAAGIAFGAPSFGDFDAFNGFRQSARPVAEVGDVSVGQGSADSWHSVSLGRTYDQPVVIMSPLTHDGGQGAHVRLRNVGPDRFEFQIEEWDFRNGIHRTERASYLVVEAGTHHLMSDVKLIAGAVSADEAPTDVSFSDPFSRKPVVLSQAQSVNGYQAIVSCNQNVTTDGFALRLQEEEANNGDHRFEAIGYVAIEQDGGSAENGRYEAGRTADTITDDPRQTVTFDGQFGDEPLLLADLQTFDGPNPAGLRYHNLASRGVDLFVEEEQSADAEINHVAEVAGYFVFSGPTMIYATHPRTVGEVGKVQADAANTNDWQSVSFQDAYNQPIVVMKPPSANGTSAVDVRLRNVTGDGFEFKLEEWGVNPGSHPTETISYLAIESGTSTVGDTTIHADRFPIQNTDEWSPTQFAQNGFDTEQPPVLLSQVQTYAGSDTVLTRHRNVRPDGFELKIQEREANPQRHKEEMVGFIALSQGMGGTNDIEYDVGRTTARINHEGDVVTFDRTLGDNPAFLADMQTQNGSNPADLRYYSLESSQARLYVEEGQSADSETWHANEAVGYAVFGGTGELVDGR